MVRTLKDTRCSTEVVQSALQCISSLCLGDSDAAVVNRRQLGAQGAIEAIDSALNRYPRHVDVLFAGVKALWTLSTNDSSNMQRMREVDVAARLTGPGFQQLVKDPACTVAFCEMCFCLVVSMALPSAASREELGQHGACTLVLNVFERPRPPEVLDEARLLTAALQAMATLCLDCPLNVRRFGPAGCETLARVLVDRRLPPLEVPSAKALRRQACLAAASLLTVHGHKHILMAGEVLRAVAGCLEAPRLEDDVPYVEAVLLALEAMTSDASHPQHLPAPRIVQDAIQTLRSMSCRGKSTLPVRVATILRKLKASESAVVAGMDFLYNVLRPTRDEGLIELKEALGAKRACVVAAEAIGSYTEETDELVVRGYRLAISLCIKCPANVERCIALRMHASAFHALTTAAELAAQQLAQGGDSLSNGRKGSIGVAACCFLGELLLNARGLEHRAKLKQRLRQDGACEALLAYLSSPGVRGNADIEQAVIKTVGLLLDGQWEGAGRLQVASALELLGSTIAKEPQRGCRVVATEAL